MRRCMSIFLVFQLFGSLQLFSMYSSLRTGAARAVRNLYNQKNTVLPHVRANSHIDGLNDVPFYGMRRNNYATYADQGAANERPDINQQDVFVQDEQWRETPPVIHKIFFEGRKIAEPNVSSSILKSSPFVIENYFSRPIEPQVASSRVQEADVDVPSVISWQEYEPEPYEALNPLQKKLVREDDYAKFVEEYRNLKDVRISKFTYMIDGQPVVGFGLLPKEAPEGSKYPLVIALRGGFNGEGDFYEWSKIDLPYIMRHFSFYAKNGYAVLTSQYRGADGNTNKDEFGGGDVRDVLGLLDVARNMGTIDLNNVSISAFSRGTVMAYKTLKAIKDKIPVKAVVIKGGISDLNTFVKDDPKYIKPILEQARPDFNERTKEICTDISLVCDAGVLKDIPTLVMHNERDCVVPAQLSRNLVEKLKDQGTEYEAHFFPGKHHQILESNDQVQDLTINWLNKHMNKNIKASL